MPHSFRRPTLLGLLAFLAACAPKADKIEAEPVAPPPRTASVSCEAAVLAIHELVVTTGSDAENRSLRPLDEDVQRCKDQRWPAALLACASNAATLDGYRRECEKIAFGGDIALTARREVPIDAELRDDGDFAIYKRAPQGRCGMLLKRVEPVSAVFVLCGDRLMAGPLTTRDEIKGAARDLSDRARSAYDVRRPVLQSTAVASYTLLDTRRSFTPSE